MWKTFELWGVGGGPVGISFSAAAAVEQVKRAIGHVSHHQILFLM